MIDRVFEKVRVHIRDTAFSPNPRWIFFRMLHIFDRRIRLPPVVFKADATYWATEDHLEPFMQSVNGGCCVDIGANIGFWTVILLKKGFNVYAFEPDPRPFKSLVALKKDYGDRLQCENIALGEKDFQGALKVCYYSGHGSLVKEASDYTGKKMSIPVRKLDSFAGIIPKIGLIKIDTEGYERQILIGATETIKRNKPRLVIEVHTPYFEEHRAICMWLQLMEYTFKTVYKKTGQPHIIADPIRRIV